MSKVFALPSLAIGVVTLLFGTLVPARATAVYVAATFAETSYGQATATAAYNSTGIFTPTGGSSFSGATPLVTAGGTTDNTGLALYAIDQTVGGGTSRATAISDLSTGALKVLSASDVDPNFASGNRATAEYLDTLHFSFAGAGPTTVTNVVFQLSLDGSLVAAAPSIGGDVIWSVNIGGATLVTYITDISSAGSCPTAYTACISQQGASGFINPTYISDTPTNIIFNGTVALTGANPSLTITNFLDAGNTLAPSSFDFSHTSLLSFTLPTGGSYTSDSGVFDTVQDSGAPEPASFGLIGLGVLCVVGLKRIKRQKA